MSVLLSLFRATFIRDSHYHHHHHNHQHRHSNHNRSNDIIATVIVIIGDPLVFYTIFICPLKLQTFHVETKEHSKLVLTPNKSMYHLLSASEIQKKISKWNSFNLKLKCICMIFQLTSILNSSHFFPLLFSWLNITLHTDDLNAVRVNTSSHATNIVCTVAIVFSFIFRYIWILINAIACLYALQITFYWCNCIFNWGPVARFP